MLPKRPGPYLLKTGKQCGDIAQRACQKTNGHS